MSDRVRLEGLRAEPVAAKPAEEVQSFLLDVLRAASTTSSLADMLAILRLKPHSHQPLTINLR